MASPGALMDGLAGTAFREGYGEVAHAFDVVEVDRFGFKRGDDASVFEGGELVAGHGCFPGMSSCFQARSM